jgi:multisubunit Na+/H+ antiporter MnhE subunit
MLHAAAMLIGFFLIGLLALQQGASAPALAAAVAIASAAVLFGARFGGVGRTAFGSPQLLALAAVRTRTVLRGAGTTIRAAAAADITLKPALVRVKARPRSAFGRAALADLIGAPPGVAIVDTDVDGMLVHVTDEDSVDAVDIGALEARVVYATERARR